MSASWNESWRSVTYYFTSLERFSAANNVTAAREVGRLGINTECIAKASNPIGKMIGLTGSEDQVAAASKAYRTYYKAHSGDPDYYLVDHSTFSYLVLPEHGFVEFFRRDVGADAIAERMACFIDNA